MSKTRHRLKALRRRGSKRFDKSCRSHGGCPWCRGNREHKNSKARHPEKDID